MEDPASMKVTKANLEEIERRNKEKLKNKEEENITSLKYDPNKKYRWEPESQFLLSGEEFGVILNSLRAILNTPEAQRILLVERASKLIDNSLARAVEIGIVQEDKK